MKIECQSCGAAYKIADEKVQGKKVFKIKCKKCSSDIIVRGTDYAAEPQRPSEDEATRAMSTETGDEPIWHVVLNGEQQGPYSVSQVRELLAGGHIDAETYVWRDGFDGWLPMQEVGELAVVFSAPPQESEPPFMGNDLFASIAPPAAVEAPAPVAAPAASELYAAPEPSRSSARPVTGEPAKARAKVGGGDLFATEARAQEASKPLFSGADEAPAAPSNGEAMTGQRNENSVLFSLATLQQLSGPKDAAPAGEAAGDSSGLIDINKLAGALNATPAARAKSSVDDILTVGATGGLSSPLAAPVLAPVAVPVAAVVAPVAPPPAAAGSKNMNFAIIAAALIIVGGGIAAAMIVKGRGDGDNPSANVASNTNPNVAPAPPSPEPAAPAPLPTTQPEAAPTPTPAPEAAPTPAPAAAPAQNDQPRERERPRDRAPSAAARTAPAAAPSSAPSPSPSPSPAPSRPRPAASGSLDDLMNSVARPTAGSNNNAAPAAAASNVPEMPARPAVASAMRGVGPAVRACGTGSGGTATVTVVFNNQGRVNTANVAPPFAGTPVGSCIARAVRDAHLPPFSRPTFSVTFPFALN
jgi:predicted Zn finger-like uncharacterized protein